MMRLLVLLSIVWTSLGVGVTAYAAQSWDELVAEARREGKVVVIGPPDTDVRQTLPAAFKKRFGIAVEYMGGRTSEQATRLRAERSAGLSSTDVTIGGVQSMSTIFYREKMLAPLRPALVLPDVVDPSKWKKGGLWFADPEQQYVLRLSSQVQPSFYINTGAAKPEEFRSGRDLLDPKWKGKIAAEDPALLGSGVNMAARIFIAFGEEGVKRLYVDQAPRISRDQRQLTDWLLRGTYPIVFNADIDQVERMRKEGLPVMAIYGLPGLPATVSAGFGMLAMFDSAPHPAAAQVFVNWLASREGMEIWARARKESPTRNDIDEASFLSATAIPQPGVTYLDTYDWDFTVNIREKVRRHMKDLLGR
jgi:ABC-type Fe3+ transport system substrate-binding protein